jgi:hypothetical protein
VHSFVATILAGDSHIDHVARLGSGATHQVLPFRAEGTSDARVELTEMPDASRGPTGDYGDAATADACAGFTKAKVAAAQPAVTGCRGSTGTVVTTT